MGDADGLGTVLPGEEDMVLARQDNSRCAVKSTS